MKNKKDIVTLETLHREFEKKTNLNKELRSDIKNIKMEMEILKRQNKTTYKPKDWRTPKKVTRKSNQSVPVK